MKIRPIAWGTLFLLALGNCNSDPATIIPSDLAHSFVVSGQARMADGAPAPLKNLQFIFLAGGVNLFPSSCQGDPHMQGSLESQLQTNSDSSFSVDIPLMQMTSNANKSCTVRAALGQMDSLKITASIDADADTCASYCRIQGAGAPSCMATCVNGTRRITAIRTLSKSELVSLDRTSAGGRASIASELVFNNLGPPLHPIHGVDLVVNAAAAQTSAHVSTESFGATDCAVVEGCINASGERKLLRFDGSIQNLGDADFVLGAPENNSSFKYSACHDHYHLQDIMLYELLNAATHQPITIGGSAVVGRKQGFCMTDTNLIAGVFEGKFECESQGITAGWEDVYDSSLDCQWIDVTGVPSGQYLLRITVNPMGRYIEADHGNNSAEVPVTVP